MASLFLSSPNPTKPYTLYPPKTLLKPSPAFNFFLSKPQPHFKFLCKKPTFRTLYVNKHNPDEQFSDPDKPREECGVVGISGDPEASRLCYLSLHALQHRGQEGAGIVSRDDSGEFRSITGLGLVSEVFNEGRIDQLRGNFGIGHVRYSTSGSSSTIKNVQPFSIRNKFGQIGVSHNGNFVNYESLRRTLEEDGANLEGVFDII